MSSSSAVIASLEAEISTESRELEARQEALRIAQQIADHEDLFKIFYQGAKETTVPALSGPVREELCEPIAIGAEADAREEEEGLVTTPPTTTISTLSWMPSTPAARPSTA